MKHTENLGNPMSRNYEPTTPSSRFRVCVIGLGFVGLTMSLALTSKKIQVFGVDTNSKTIDQLRIRKTDVQEPGIINLLDISLKENLLNLLHTSEDLEIISNCNVFVITVGTPLKDGQVNLQYVQNAIEQILPYISNEALVIVRSTTIVGASDGLIRSLLNTKSPTIKLAMCPERTVEGKALEEIFSLPQIIGADSDVDFMAAKSFFDDLSIEVIRVGSLKAAEMTKLINNTYRDLMFAFANEIAFLAQKYELSASEMIHAANYKYPRSQISLPGLSGGPCLEKDPWILIESGKKVDIEMRISKAARIINENTIYPLLDKSLELKNHFNHVAILGLSFKGKPNVLDSRGSFAQRIVDYLKKSNSQIQISGYEPAGLFNHGLSSITQVSSLEMAIEGSELLIVATNASEFENIENLCNAALSKNALIVDYWGIINKEELRFDIEYLNWS